MYYYIVKYSDKITTYAYLSQLSSWIHTTINIRGLVSAQSTLNSQSTITRPTSSSASSSSWIIVSVLQHSRIQILLRGINYIRSVFGMPTTTSNPPIRSATNRSWWAYRRKCETQNIAPILVCAVISAANVCVVFVLFACNSDLWPCVCARECVCVLAYIQYIVWYIMLSSELNRCTWPQGAARHRFFCNRQTTQHTAVSLHLSASVRCARVKLVVTRLLCSVSRVTIPINNYASDNKFINYNAQSRTVYRLCCDISVPMSISRTWNQNGYLWYVYIYLFCSTRVYTNPVYGKGSVQFTSN